MSSSKNNEGGRADDEASIPRNGLFRAFRVAPGEAVPLALSFGYFFLLLCSYYVLRPLREEMLIRSGVATLQWLQTATFIVMVLLVPVFGALVARVARRRLLPVLYLFFASNLVVFFLLFRAMPEQLLVARAFYVWVSVFNMFVVSVFWSFMTDLYRPAQAERLFSIVAAGGTLGAIAGSKITESLAIKLGPVGLLPISALLLCGTLLCIWQLLRIASAPQSLLRQQAAGVAGRPIGGSVWAGLRLLASSRYLAAIACFVLLYTVAATFLYFQQAHIVSAAFDDSGERTRFFARMDLAVNILAVGLQFFVTGRLAQRFGLAFTLAVVPVLVAIGFVALSVAPVLGVLVVVEVMRRAGEFAITKPARETLFTLVDRESRYKAKNVIDTTVYRGGDLGSGWVYVGLSSAGLGMAGIAAVGAPLCLVWATVALWLGRRYARERAAE